MLPLRLGILLLFVASFAAACAGTHRNADCRFPSDELTRTPAGRVDGSALDHDALIAEDLAIRFADRTAGLKSKWPQGRTGYRQVRDECMASLFAIVARHHGVSVVEVREAAAHRSLRFDVLVLLSFLALYTLVALNLVTRILDGGLGSRRTTATLAILAASLVCALLAVGVGHAWSGLAETIRIGNGHASYRANRVPWREYRTAAFGVCLVMFWLVALYRSWTTNRRPLALRQSG